MADELKLPDLAPQTFEEIFRSLRDGIPAYSSNWTDYNPSDPGITLLQLFAWIASGTYYRINRVPDECYRNYLLMAAGTPEQGVPAALKRAQSDVIWQGGKRLQLGAATVPLDPAYIALLHYLSSIAGERVPAAELHEVGLRFWSSRYRAVTADDFEALAVECTASVASWAAAEKVARAFAADRGGLVEVTIVSGYIPQYQGASSPPTPADPGVIAIARTVLVRPGGAVLKGYEKLVYAVGAYLAPRRLIGTPLRVRAVRYTPLVASADLVVAEGFDPAAVLAEASALITRLVDPITGGPSGDGYPYGRALTGEDLVTALRDLDGVDRSQPVNASVKILSGTRVGSARIGLDTVVAAPGTAFELPALLSVTVRAMRSTWTIEVGVHAVIGLDTRLPPAGGA
ncbi:hypothetical protein WME79_17155 [Sorangium sp. So ce726]|uniref:hypothetical protein n=1 Tax=Sorangium sp. So ce726 TaxID=3133319 RepID=UPI003F61C25A